MLTILIILTILTMLTILRLTLHNNVIGPKIVFHYIYL